MLTEYPLDVPVYDWAVDRGHLGDYELKRDRADEAHWFRQGGVDVPDRCAGRSIAAVEDHAGEVQVVTLPGHRGVLAQVGGDQADDGVPDLAQSGE
ncbi:hypothetical protein OG589_20240 [Sphaerisporangium sp. NBC_01403]|uniref:hypothetical protein n=1 Tax=Sphaerisporangium sp. NBC_01403 TaxID=2903599 RepID=UPI00324B866C